MAGGVGGREELPRFRLSAKPWLGRFAAEGLVGGREDAAQVSPFGETVARAAAAARGLREEIAPRVLRRSGLRPSLHPRRSALP